MFARDEGQTPSATAPTDAETEETVEELLGRLDEGACLVTDTPALREGQFLRVDASFEDVECDRPHTLLLAHNRCDEVAVAVELGLPSYVTRVVADEPEQSGSLWDVCLMGLNNRGTLEPVTWRLEDLDGDSAWTAMQIGACVSWDTEDLVASLAAPEPCSSGSALLFETEVDTRFGASPAEMALMTDSVCGPLATESAPGNGAATGLAWILTVTHRIGVPQGCDSARRRRSSDCASWRSRVSEAAAETRRRCGTDRIRLESSIRYGRTPPHVSGPACVR